MAALLALALLAGCQPATPATLPMNDDHTLYDFKVKSLEGKDVDLADYKGKLVLVVNTASKCGLTPQYKGLEAMYEKYKEKDFVILGFPANDFGNQEPGTATEIVEFCDRNYGVTFPMFEKSTVLGENKSELYKWLVSNSDRPKDEIEWNFAKFLVSREGKVIARFEPKETPEMIDEKIAKAL